MRDYLREGELCAVGAGGTQKRHPWVFQHPCEPSTQDGAADQGALLGDGAVCRGDKGWTRAWLGGFNDIMHSLVYS